MKIKNGQTYTDQTFDGGLDETGLKNVRFLRCTFRGFTWNGRKGCKDNFRLTECEDCVADNCVFSVAFRDDSDDPESHGVCLDKSKRCRIIRPRVDGMCTGDPINLFSSEHCSVERGWVRTTLKTNTPPAGIIIDGPGGGNNVICGVEVELNHRIVIAGGSGHHLTKLRPWKVELQNLYSKKAMDGIVLRGVKATELFVGPRVKAPTQVDCEFGEVTGGRQDDNLEHGRNVTQ